VTNKRTIVFDIEADASTPTTTRAAEEESN
jgi:hypothetical protein